MPFRLAIFRWSVPSLGWLDTKIYLKVQIQGLYSHRFDRLKKSIPIVNRDRGELKQHVFLMALGGIQPPGSAPPSRAKRVMGDTGDVLSREPQHLTPEGLTLGPRCAAISSEATAPHMRCEGKLHQWCDPSGLVARVICTYALDINRSSYQILNFMYYAKRLIDR